MKVFLPEEIAETCRRNPADFAVFEGFRQRIEQAERWPEVRNRFEKIRGRSTLWKFRGRGYFRLIFSVNSTPALGRPYAVVHGIFDHDTYDRLHQIGSLTDVAVERRLGQPDVLRFIASIDSGPAPRRVEPGNYVGLTAPITPPTVPLVGDEVSESAMWVDDVLAPLLARADDNRLDQIARAVLEVIDSVPSATTGDTLVRRHSGRVLVTKPDEDLDAPERRKYALDPGRVDRLAHLRDIQRVSGATVDPFLRTHESQDKVLSELEANFWNALPGLIDGPGGSGKTALLMMIAKGVLQSRPESNIRLITASSDLVAALREALSNHLRLVDGMDSGTADELAVQSVETVNNYILALCTEDTARRFADGDRRVEWAEFYDWYHSQGVPLSNGLRSGASRLSAQEAWSTIRTLVSGDSELRDEVRWIHDEAAFCDRVRGLPANRLRMVDLNSLPDAVRVHNRYEEWKRDNGLWDDCDLARAALAEGLAPAERRRAPDLVIVDEAQDLTPDMFRCIVRSSRCFDVDIGGGRARGDGVIPLPYVFAADDLQTINPSGFDWPAFLQLLDDETSALLNSMHGASVRRYGLSFNFRMMSAPNAVATGLRRWMRPAEASETDTLRHGGVSKPVEAEAEIADALRTSARIIVPQKNESPRVRELLEAHLGPKPPPERKFENPRWGRVISAAALKGLECESAALVGFAEHLRSATTGPALRYAQQVTYVAASRARGFSFWIETSPEDFEWMWVRGEGGPAPEFIKPTVHGDTPAPRYPPISEAEDYLKLALTDLSSDRGARGELANVAAAQFFESGHAFEANFSSKISSYFDGFREGLRAADLPARWRELFVPQIFADEHWSFFDGPLPDDAGTIDRAGWIAHALLTSQLEMAIQRVEACTGHLTGSEPLPDALRAPVASLAGRLTDSWRRSIEATVDDGDGGRADARDSDPRMVSATALRLIADFAGDRVEPLEALQLLRSEGELPCLRRLAGGFVTDGRTALVEAILVRRRAKSLWLTNQECARLKLRADMNDGQLLAALERAVHETLVNPGAVQRIRRMTGGQIDSLAPKQQAELAEAAVDELVKILNGQ